MKKLVLFIAAIAFGTLGTQAAKTEDNVVTATTYRYGNSFIFVEDGVTFSVYPDGEFDFYLDNRVNVGVGAQIGNVGITFNSGYNYDPYVQYDDYGAVIQVENTPIFYDYYGRVSQIGSVDIWYNNGRVRRLGGLHVYYNGGVFSHYTGFINIYNRHYVYRPFHRYFARPAIGFCTVYSSPYRRYYSPIRYTYYAPYRNNYRRAYAKVGRSYKYNPDRRSRVYRNDKRVAVRDNASIRRGYTGRSNKTVARNDYRKGNTVSRSNTVKRQVAPNRTSSKRVYQKADGVSRNSGRTVAQKQVTRTPNRKTVSQRKVTTTPNRKTVTRTTTSTYKKPQARSNSSRSVVSRQSAPKKTVSRSTKSTNVRKSTGRTSNRSSSAGRTTKSSRRQ
ncbi:hypothetical protein F8C76_03625 [Flagellimonas olearia]|uniref:Sperm nuclear basic protein PL-I n=1 Tax=Flagellimonas olearia TaxID=552546 RepID=A0A6I1E1U7_9FLAO|nr:hypothetical protein [Allomuricauda olearia]KAB7530602.1 hypothetical protein F8C76_03625 [Allomuricauda olearia]